MRILLLEDDAAWAEDTSRKLERAFDDVNVDVVSSEAAFRDAFEKLKRSPPDVAILDVLVRWSAVVDPMPAIPPDVEGEGPYLAGIRCLRLLLSDPATARVPTIVRSVVDTETVRRLGGQLPPHVLFAPKSLEDDYVETCIRSLLQDPPSERHVVRGSTTGPSPIRWETMSDATFERLVFALFCDASGWEDPSWLMETRAPDRGRDMAAWRVDQDELSGTHRRRVIVQCKHRRGRSIDVTAVAKLREQMRLWEPPRVDLLVIATSGRFSLDTVQLIERHNQSDAALRIEMWPDSHLEKLLMRRPALRKQFGI